MTSVIFLPPPAMPVIVAVSRKRGKTRHCTVLIILIEPFTYFRVTFFVLCATSAVA